MNKLIINWSTFSLCNNPITNVTIMKEDYKRLDLMVVYTWNFAHVRKQPKKRIFFIKIFNFFSSCEVHIRCFENIC
jgi:hypothetical protein